MEQRPIIERRAIVIGAGVTGLTSAITLLRDGWKVKIIAEKISPNTTSDGPAALWEPYLSEPEHKVYQWCVDALDEFLHLRDTDTSAGVWMTYGYDFSVLPAKPRPRWLSLVYHRDCTPDELPKGYKSGFYYAVPMIEIPVFMPWLMRTFQKLGGVLEVRKLNSLNDLFKDTFQPSVVVNCCGLGAYELCNDKQMVPIRGQVLKVDAPFVKHFYTRMDMDDKDLLYIFPRSDCVVLGGTAHVGEWEVKTDEDISKQIVDRCEEIVPGIKNAKVKTVWTGLRPGRTTVRLEEEVITHPSRLHKLHIIHNYGHGGSGVTLSWGCAKEVLQKARLYHRKLTDAVAKL